MKSTYPETEIHYLTRKKFAEVLQYNPNIDHLWTVNKSPSEIQASLPSQFDYIIDLHKNWRSRIFALQHPFTKYRSFPKLNIGKWMLVTFKINFLPEKHIVERYFHALQDFGLTYDGQGLDFFFPPDFSMELFFPPNGYLAAVIGGTYTTKKYPAHKWVEIFQLLHFPVVLLGGTDAVEEGNYIAQHSPFSINLCGKLSIIESSFYLKNAALVITHDTGLMHIAAALQKPIVSIWGNTVPAFGMYPLLPDNMKESSVVIEHQHLSCRPCSKLGYTHCPKKHFKCMNELAPQVIAQAILQLLSQNN